MELITPLVNPSRIFHDVCAYWLMSSDGSNANAQAHHARRMASEVTTCVRHLRIWKYILAQTLQSVLTP